MKQLAQAQTAAKWQSQCLNPGLPESGAHGLSPVHSSLQLQTGGGGRGGSVVRPWVLLFLKILYIYFRERENMSRETG